MDIAELGYKVDSSGLVEGTKALDENAAAADRAGGAADRLDREYSALARTVERSSSALGDRLGGALDRIGTGTGAVITELQTLNRTNTEILASLGALDGKLTSTAAQAQAYGAAGAAAAASTAQVATASQQLEKQLADQDARLKGVAQRAMEWAASNREANLSERALAEAARDAALGIDHKARALAGAGSEQDRMVARARALEEAEARAANQVRQAAAAAEAQQINLKQLLGQIDPTVGALNRLAAMEDRLERAHKAGLINPAVFDQYQTKIDAMRASVLNATGAQNGMGMSARQLQNNLRMIPMQVTDITTSLISGQPAWMVAIQQGGQLKDAFGGIAPAARALGGYLLGLVNPYTVAAAGAAAFALALKQGSDELYDFQRNLILSGRDVGVTFGQFERMVDQLDRIQGVSRGGAVDALNAVAKSGQFAGQQFDLVAASAARMESSLGVSADRTVALFDKITKDPVDGLLELQKQWGRVTQAQIDNVYQLQQQGDEVGALMAALKAADQASQDMARSAEANLPAMTAGWRSVKDEVSGAWGEVVNFANAMAGLAKINIDPESPIMRVLFAQPRMALSFAGGLRDELNSLAAQARNPNGLPTPIDETGGADDRKRLSDYGALIKDNATAQQAAAEAINAQVAGLDRASAKEAARLKIIAQYNKLADNDARHFDGSMQRLIAKAQADVDKSFNRRDGVGKRNGDDSAAQNMLAAAQRQIEANKQLVETGVKVTESERQAMAIEQVLAKSKNTMTASTRALLTAAREELLASGQKAAAYTKEKEAAEALARQQAILAQASSNRARSNELDLMGMGRGSDAVAMLRRQLDIQREYQDELKRIGSRDVAADKASWDLLAANAAAYRDSELAKERTFQEQRLAMLGDWRAGARRAWEDYSFAASNALEQANSVMNTALSGWEDAWVRFAQTGKLSFRDMANAIIADLARIAAKQAAVGLINAVASAWGGGVTAAGNAAATSGTQSINEGLLAGYGGGRARGGPVSGSTLYEVGEGGKPELFNDGRGRTYLIPGNDGQVIPAAPATAAGAGPAGGASVINVKVVVNSDGTTETDADTSLMNQFGKELGQFVDMKIREAQVKSMKPGGVLHSMGAGR